MHFSLFSQHLNLVKLATTTTTTTTRMHHKFDKAVTLFDWKFLVPSPQWHPVEYRLGVVHFSTSETLVVKFQALLQSQCLLLIPTYFTFSCPSKKQCLKWCVEATFEALHVIFLTLTSHMDYHEDRVTQQLLICNVWNGSWANVWSITCRIFDTYLSYGFPCR